MTLEISSTFDTSFFPVQIKSEYQNETKESYVYKPYHVYIKKNLSFWMSLVVLLYVLLYLLVKVASSALASKYSVFVYKRFPLNKWLIGVTGLIHFLYMNIFLVYYLTPFLFLR